MSAPHEKYLVTLSEGTEGAWANVWSLPGCVVGGRTAAEIASSDVIQLGIAEFIFWLRKHGEDYLIPDPTLVEVVEDKEIETRLDEALTKEELRAGIRRMGFARQDLLALIEGLPISLLDWTPPESTVERFDSWAPGVRSIRDILQHIAGADRYYTRTILGVPDAPDIEWSDIAGQRQHALDSLQSLNILTSKVREALSNYIHHERFHTKEIERRLADIVLSAPG